MKANEKLGPPESFCPSACTSTCSLTNSLCLHPPPTFFPEGQNMNLSGAVGGIVWPILRCVSTYKQHAEHPDPLCFLKWSLPLKPLKCLMLLFHFICFLYDVFVCFAPCMIWLWVHLFWKVIWAWISIIYGGDSGDMFCQSNLAFKAKEAY